MKNRNRLSYSLDILGLTLLGSAGLALLAALWFAGASQEATLVGSFRLALMLAVGAFLVARSIEIVQIIQHDRVAEKPITETYTADNVEHLPKRDSLPRAA